MINFILCSGVLLLVYRVFLRNENLYRFNRFYLLFSLVFSLIVSFITICVPQMPLPGQQFNKQVSTTITTPGSQPVVDKTTSVILNTKVYQQEGPAIAPASVNTPVPQYTLGFRLLNYLPQALICLYLIAFMALLIRFIRNSYHISRKVTENTIITDHDTSLVLLEEEVTPHSFLKYVFINKKDYQDGLIEPEIICHEQAHVRQLHSLDVILVELLQVICWFNPFIPLYRRAIQLNHEFLADQEVIKNYHNTPAYQYLVLVKSAQCGSLYLTSQFNYLTTKKRLIMMTKNTSAKIALLKQLALAPVLAGVVLLFSHKVMAQAKNADKAATDKKQEMLPNDRHKPIAAARYDVPKGTPVIVRGIKVIAPAKTDAPQSVLDEYTALLKKDNLPAGAVGKVIVDFTLPDQHQLQDLFNQMSKKQQNNQAVLFGPVLTPSAKNSPDSKRLADLQDISKYDLWIDGKRVSNNELAKYKPSELVEVEVSQYPNNPVKVSEFRKAELMTLAYYAKDCKQVLADNYQTPIVQYSANKTAKTEAAPDFLFITKPVPPAKHDAPQGVLDEYAAILKKYNLPPDTSKMHGQLGINFSTSNADRLRLQDLFNQMSRTQQNKQQIQYGELELPSPKRSPTDQQLANWQDSKKFRVWIDDKNAGPQEIAKYKAADFDGWDVAHLSETTNPNYKNHQYEVHLMTQAGYNNYYKQVVNDRRQMPIWTVLREKYSKHKAE